MQIEQVVELLQRYKGEWRAISRASGVPYETVTKVAQQRTRNPTIRTVEKLARVLSRRPRQRWPEPER